MVSEAFKVLDFQRQYILLQNIVSISTGYKSIANTQLKISKPLTVVKLTTEILITQQIQVIMLIQKIQVIMLIQKQRLVGLL